MPQRCKSCAHPRVAAIDKEILGKLSYRSIAFKYGLVPQSLRKHGLNHLKPVVDQANKKAEAAIVKQITEYREEVNYATLDKVKMLQQRILNDLDATPKVVDRVPLYREFRGALQEQARLCGEYQQNRENAEKEARVIRAVKDFLAEHPEMDRNYVIDTFAAGRGIPRERIIELLGVIG